MAWISRPSPERVVSIFDVDQCWPRFSLLNFDAQEADGWSSIMEYLHLAITAWSSGIGAVAEGRFENFDLAAVAATMTLLALGGGCAWRVYQFATARRD
jgi:hypothetical protein